MKKLSKDERKGAIAFIIVVILIIAFTFLLRNHVSDKNADDARITIIYNDNAEDADSMPADTEKSTKSKVGKRKNKKSGSSKARSGKKSSKRSGTSETSSSRDFLTDTIPTR